MSHTTGQFDQDRWAVIRQRHAAWWRREGLVLHVMAPRDSAHESANTQAPFYHLMGGIHPTEEIIRGGAWADFWLDPAKRVARADTGLQQIHFAGEAFPFFDTNIGPGNLATFLGSEPVFARDTVWYEPCISDPDEHPPLRFDPRNEWFQRQKALVEAGVVMADGRYPVSMPDLVENLDILASLRDAQTLMMDMIERPDFVKARLEEINQAYFAAFDALYDIVSPGWGGNVFSAFSVWGDGKTAKVQCDACVMISPAMFASVVAPVLAAQCEWLDHSLYHLDGTQAMRHLDALLEIDALDAIEWTPQVSIPQGGDPTWFDMYRRILDAGKCVQAINVQPDEVVPLLDALGPSGLFLMVNAESEAQAEALVRQVEAFR